jgi:hypothetical protein
MNILYKQEGRKKGIAMKGLMLHCGAELKSRDEVFGVPVPTETATYKPLPYESFVVRIEKQLMVGGIQIEQTQFALSKNGQRLFGLMELQMRGPVNSDYGFVLGLRTSYDKSFPNAVCIGASVFVCDNLSFHGEITFTRKHTPGMLRDLSWLISETVAQLPVKFTEQSSRFQAYKAQELEDKQAHDLAIRFMDAGSLNVTDIPKLLREWREPSYAQFADGRKTAWRLFNAATETIKGDLWRLPTRTKRIHEILDEECGILGDIELPEGRNGNNAVLSVNNQTGYER